MRILLPTLTLPTKLGRAQVEKIGHLSYLKTPDNAMKKTKFTETQIVFALRQADTGVTIAEVCRKMGISEATYYNLYYSPKTGQFSGAC